MNIINNFFEKLLQSKFNLKSWIVFISFAIIPLLLNKLFLNLENHDSEIKSESKSIDTIIPEGHLLIPIEVENSESLDSILGNQGIVDLFSTHNEGSINSKRIANRVPIIRAPLNPSHFAVLVPELQASKILNETGPFWVGVQNPKQVGMSFETNIKKKPNLVRVLNGGVQ